MKFTEYVVLDKVGQAMDPLGFRRPAGALQDTLFPQFTVLTKHPVYFGALCCFIGMLESSAPEDSRTFARQFRNLEIFWGLANAEAGLAVVNVTKYQNIRADEVQLASIPKRHSIFQRLAYGTLGHYSRAAMQWGLLDAGGRKQLHQGGDLGSAFASRRSGFDLDRLLRQWLAGHSFSRAELVKVGATYGIAAPPLSKEQAVWQGIVEDWCRRNPSTRPLWKSPMTSAQLADGQASAELYQDLWRQVGEAYPSLTKEIVAIVRFERLASAIQFIFDRRVSVLEFGDRFEDVPPRGADPFAALVVSLAKDYETAPGFLYAKRLFTALAMAPPDFGSLTQLVVEHHIQHQQTKGTLPFIDHKKVLVNDRVNPLAVADAMSAFDDRDESPKAQLGDLQFRFRRQWHFEKCRRWSDWSNGITGVEE